MERTVDGNEAEEMRWEMSAKSFTYTLLHIGYPASETTTIPSAYPITYARSRRAICNASNGNVNSNTNIYVQ